MTGWLVRFWFRVILGREPVAFTREDMRRIEDYHEMRIAEARYYGVPAEAYVRDQAVLDAIRSYRQEGLLP